ncbi:MAG: sigma-54 dependent transcriptional regulator [Saprospiraceae bacterium]|nr:sigma-54 dependent transcriptional regulator [Saprospiraceae bacterium]
MEVQSIKQRFGIIGNSSLLNLAINTAQQVAATDITVFITGESGVGKESFPKIIHQLSARKHGPYIAVNCGAIPEGTIDSELFGHEKGSFTGAHDSRKGYFEVVNGGTIFLDEVAELPLSTQVRLLRVLETGEFMKVGSSKVIKTDVRVVAATNINVPEAIQNGKFREDLYYRLNTVPIYVPPLKDRKEDVVLLFRKFAADFAERYRMPPIQLDPDAQMMLMNYRWPGNVRQLKNITEQISIIEKNKNISTETLSKYLPQATYNKLPVLFKDVNKDPGLSERDLLYRVLFDMKKDISELKKLIADIISDEDLSQKTRDKSSQIFRNLTEDDYNKKFDAIVKREEEMKFHHEFDVSEDDEFQETEIIEESLSIQKKEIDLIKKALERHNGKRKNAAKELGISERTLYRKIKEYDIQQ